jgi:hypothetical protein
MLRKVPRRSSKKPAPRSNSSNQTWIFPGAEFAPPRDLSLTGTDARFQCKPGLSRRFRSTLPSTEIQPPETVRGSGSTCHPNPQTQPWPTVSISENLKR